MANVIDTVSIKIGTKYVIKNEYNNPSIDFSDYESVYNLNKALLKKYYGISLKKKSTQYFCLQEMRELKF